MQPERAAAATPQPFQPVTEAATPDDPTGFAYSASEGQASRVAQEAQDAPGHAQDPDDDPMWTALPPAPDGWDLIPDDGAPEPVDGRYPSGLPAG